MADSRTSATSAESTPVTPTPELAPPHPVKLEAPSVEGSAIGSICMDISLEGTSGDSQKSNPFQLEGPMYGRLLSLSTTLDLKNCSTSQSCNPCHTPVLHPRRTMTLQLLAGDVAPGGPRGGKTVSPSFPCWFQRRRQTAMGYGGAFTGDRSWDKCAANGSMEGWQQRRWTHHERFCCTRASGKGSSRCLGRN